MPFNSFKLICYLALILSATSFRLAHAATYRVTVAAGQWQRQQSVVTFDLPAAAHAYNGLREANGKTIPLQVDAHGHASFILNNLAPGATRMYELVKNNAAEAADGVQVKRNGDVLKATVGGRPVMEYEGGAGILPRPDIKPIYKRGGIIHPILSPSGKLVSDSYAPNHLHHHGVWFSWTKTEFEGRHPDFWNIGDGTGTVEFVALDDVWSGEVQGGFASRHCYVDLTTPKHKVALNETWQVTIYHVDDTPNAGNKPYWMFDLVVSQECASDSPLKLPKYHYGGLGFRGNRAWDGKDNTFFLTSEGETDRVKGNETRGRWCHIGGKVDGELTGIAILCHPDNFRAPQPMRLHPTEPFFCYAPSQGGDWEIALGKPYTSRYRFIVQDGAPDKSELDRLWNDYAHPPEVKVEAQ
ncbi:MAG: PmoA family protein [Abitibacteriaceae bacterium]|nr:PmoA family protein [Abditibacteriaceae bacterium]